MRWRGVKSDLLPKNFAEHKCVAKTNLFSFLFSLGWERGIGDSNIHLTRPFTHLIALIIYTITKEKFAIIFLVTNNVVTVI